MLREPFLFQSNFINSDTVNPDNSPSGRFFLEQHEDLSCMIHLSGLFLGNQSVQINKAPFYIDLECRELVDRIYIKRIFSSCSFQLYP
jgi:hypothetical protein